MFKILLFLPNLQITTQSTRSISYTPKVLQEQSTNLYHCIKASVESVQVVSTETSNNECNIEALVQTKLKKITNYSHA